MYEGCDLTKQQIQIGLEAIALVRMFVDGFHARLLNSGGAILEIELDEQELEWLCKFEQRLPEPEEDDDSEDDEGEEEEEEEDDE